jgi:hypothetical protein
VAVEKLNHQEMAEKTLHGEALQTTFSVWVDIFYPQLLVVLRKMEFFNSHTWLQDSVYIYRHNLVFFAWSIPEIC